MQFPPKQDLCLFFLHTSCLLSPMTTFLGVAALLSWQVSPSGTSGRPNLSTTQAEGIWPHITVLSASKKTHVSMRPANDDGCQLVFHQNDSAGKASLEGARWPIQFQCPQWHESLYIYFLCEFSLLQIYSNSTPFSWWSHELQISSKLISLNPIHAPYIAASVSLSKILLEKSSGMKRVTAPTCHTTIPQVEERNKHNQ